MRIPTPCFLILSSTLSDDKVWKYLLVSYGRNGRENLMKMSDVCFMFKVMSVILINF